MVKQFFCLIWFLFFCVLPIRSQTFLNYPTADRDLITESDKYEYGQAPAPKDILSRASGWFDVTYYSIYLTVNTSQRSIDGDVLIKGFLRNTPDTALVLDLSDNMLIGSVLVDSADRPFSQDTSSFSIDLPDGYAEGDSLTVEVKYHGTPVGTGFGSISFSSHSDVSWVWTLSQPYGAKDWWPCKDHPSDKADSADIAVRCDSAYKVGSNGRLVSVVNNGDGTKTHHWQERYPISSYLISIALTNYEQFSLWYKYAPDDSMEILNYVLPERLSLAREQLPRVLDMMEIFSELFGEYPFIKEKYGHADFGRGGAMEHQTMTSTTTYSELTVAHELAHQWFGDMITCRGWQDIWLNEGFAQYSTALYLEKRYGKSSYWNYMRVQLGTARLARGPLFVEDTSTVRTLFDNTLVYSKGASVLHMLRHVLIDSVFFKSMLEYANSPSLKYGVSSTSDFQSACESASGKDLDYFFDEWVFGKGYPTYALEWDVLNAGGSEYLKIVINQSNDQEEPAFFKMPVDIKIEADGWDTTLTVFNDSLSEEFLIPVSHFITSVQLDPEGWILKDLSEELPSSIVLTYCYPNPFQARTKIEYKVPKRMNVSLEIYNAIGQRISILVDGVQMAGAYSVDWWANGQPAGIYFYRLRAGSRTLSGKMVLLK